MKRIMVLIGCVLLSLGATSCTNKNKEVDVNVFPAGAMHSQPVAVAENGVTLKVVGCSDSRFHPKDINCVDMSGKVITGILVQRLGHIPVSVTVYYRDKDK